MSNSAPWRLDVARALITGGSSGIGLATAREMASLGAGLVLVARNQDRLESARESIESEYPGCKVEIIPADLSSERGRTKVLEQQDAPLLCLTTFSHKNIFYAGWNIWKAIW